MHDSFDLLFLVQPIILFYIDITLTFTKVIVVFTICALLE